MEKENKFGGSMSDFVAINVHQLKAPLVANKWALSSLQSDLKGKLSKDQLELVEKVYESNERALALAENILRAEAEESSAFELNFSQVDIEELTNSIIKRLENEASKKKIKVIFRKSQDPLPKLRADKEKLCYAFENIIGNAIHYTPEGGSVSIDELDRGDKIEVSVADTGIGILDSEQAHIFKKFFRGNNIDNKKMAGSGLGLFISKNIIEKHNGEVSLQSQEGEGTILTVTLPLNADK